jgi:hypothetical protein
MEMKGDWRKLRNEELHDLYSSPDTITLMALKRTGWGECSTHRSDEILMYSTDRKSRRKESSCMT